MLGYSAFWPECKCNLIRYFPHFEHVDALFLGQFAVKHGHGSLQVLPLLVDVILPLLQSRQEFSSLLLQALEILVLLLIQEAMEVPELGSDLSFQFVEPTLKNHTATRWPRYSVHG